MGFEGRTSCSGDGSVEPNILAGTEENSLSKLISPYMLTTYTELETAASSSKAELSALKSPSSDERHPACKKKCSDWKPGKLMSLHFYLLNLYRLLCQGLWGISVPSLVIVFSLFAWESDTFSWNLGESMSQLFHMAVPRRPRKSV